MKQIAATFTFFFIFVLHGSTAKACSGFFSTLVSSYAEVHLFQNKTAPEIILQAPVHKTSLFILQLGPVPFFPRIINDQTISSVCRPDPGFSPRSARDFEFVAGLSPPQFV